LSGWINATKLAQGLEARLVRGPATMADSASEDEKVPAIDGSTGDVDRDKDQDAEPASAPAGAASEEAANGSGADDADADPPIAPPTR
jgi:hypothetical protein